MTKKIDSLISQEIKQHNSFDELWNSDHGSYQEYFFHNNDDWSKVIVMFNGAVSPSQRRDGYTFQRWSWASQFRHPVIIISDPTTYGENGLNLGWYTGPQNTPYLPNALEKLTQYILQRSPNAHIVSFGSSAGGFAALAGLQLGYFDTAIAVNPQTDIELYPVKPPLRRYLDWYGRTSKYTSTEADRQRFSLIQMGFKKAKENSQIIYVQNTDDVIHHLEHMLPYCDSLTKTGFKVALKPHLFSNPGLGHNPPAINGLKKIIGEDFSSLINI